VINEIFYHAPADIPNLQWVELLNDGDQGVDLAGWRLAKGVRFRFPAGARIEPHGFLVLCSDPDQFKRYYTVPVAGRFEGSLKKGGEALELRDAGEGVVDAVEFSDRPPWPRGPAGHTASLERISPAASGLGLENWTGSPLSEDDATPGGTPGKANAAFAATLPPVIDRVSFRPARVKPGEAIQVEAHLARRGPVKQIELLYRLVGPGLPGEERSVPMSAGGAEGLYEGTVPGQAAGGVVRLRVQATDAAGVRRIFPSPTELQPALSCLVWTNLPVGRIPVGVILHVDPADVAASDADRGSEAGDFSPEGQGRFQTRMELDRQLDLPGLWTSLMLSNPPPVSNQEPIRALFARKLQDRDQLEHQLLAPKGPQKGGGGMREQITPFKARLVEELSPLVSAGQRALLERWQAVSGEGGGGPGGNPSQMLRQFIPLEAGYMHLGLAARLEPSQAAAVRNVYATAFQEREALVPLLKKVMGGPQNGPSQEGEDLQARAMALEPSVDAKLKGVLSPSQSREFLAWRIAQMPPFMRKGLPKLPESPAGNAAFVYVEPGSSEPKLYDFVQAPTRSGGWKVHFARDGSLNGMTGIDLILEASERWVLAEPLAFEFHRRAGLPAPLTDFVRLWVDGQLVGYRLLIEQPNKSFLRRNGLRDDGNLYKANWTGRGLVGQNQKRTNLQGTHEDLIQLVDQLEKSKSSPDEQWGIIRRQLDVAEVLNHYAARMLISDWDGFFNNYYLYHDLHGSGRWSLFPWDEDKTWGEYDGPKGRLLHDMPLLYGSEQDRPPGGKPGDPAPQGINPGSWWRPGGYVSKPVLANPTFRKLFLARIRELLETEFKEERLFPYVDAMQERLSEEVAIRAGLRH
ncbi:MAG TPA: hypothetical protein DCM86_12565, partial [Verrucomicrobiales bacterium]|nr:hypothetical protein [Verrucomicrobiales bacterium]